MAITDELRGWINDNYPAWKKLRTGVSDQLDRIDAKHERELTMARGEAANKTLEVMGDGYIALPKDADGEYIHEHDKVDWRDHSGTWHNNALVVAVCSDGGYVMDGMVFHVHASDIRHHKHPTVEDVLVQMLCEYDRDDFELTELIERFAAKLQLRGDE